MLSVNVVLLTEKSRSKSISSSIERVQDKWQLTYCYLNVPKANVRNRSEIHYGTALLCVENMEKIHGQYFTDRKTTGDMRFQTQDLEGEEMDVSTTKKKEWKKETRHIIAILDLLGASEMIMSDQSEIVMNGISDIFRDAESKWPYVENAPSILHAIKSVTFSDNIALALELPDELSKDDLNSAVESFITYISVFQGAAMKNGLLFRGGIALGPLYMDSCTNFIWGKALVAAHILEEKNAIYPRVVLSSQFEQLQLSKATRILRDFDGMYFVDYFSKIKEKFPDWIENNKKMIQEKYVVYAGKERVLQKYAWFEHYIE